jgi:hypothetical protein
MWLVLARFRLFKAGEKCGASVQYLSDTEGHTLPESHFNQWTKSLLERAGGFAFEKSREGLADFLRYIFRQRHGSKLENAKCRKQKMSHRVASIKPQRKMLGSSLAFFRVTAGYDEPVARESPRKAASELST